MIFAFIACHLASAQETGKLWKLDSDSFYNKGKEKENNIFLPIILNIIMLDFVPTQAS